MALISFNPNTGQKLNPGETVKNLQTGALITQGTPFMPTTINAATLQPVAPITIPIQKPDITNYNGIIAGGNATVDAINKTNAANVAVAPQENGLTDIFKQYLGADVAPTNPLDNYNTLSNQYGIDAKSQAAAASKAKVDALNAQLQGITAESQASNLGLEQTAANNGNTTTSFLGRQQAETSRQAAIKALPIQAQLLAAQAVATNDSTLLSLAQDKLDKVFTIQSTYETNLYNHNAELRKEVYQFASDEQKAKLDAQSKKADQDFQLLRDNLSNAQSLAKTAMENGSPEIAAKITALDPKSDTYKTDLAKLAVQMPVDPTKALDVQLKQAQIANTYSEIANRNSGSSKILSPTDASALGVPYGTTENQAASMGITPQGKTTAAQQTVAGFAARIEQSNDILKSLSTAIQTYNPAVFAYQMKVPQFLKSSQIQQYDQASRNLINSILRKESGAVISDQEFDNARKQYLPQPGDTDATVAQKQQNIQAVLKSYTKAAGNAYESVNDLVTGNQPATTIPFKSSSQMTQPDGSIWKQNTDGSFTRTK